MVSVLEWKTNAEVSCRAPVPFSLMGERNLRNLLEIADLRVIL